MPTCEQYADDTTGVLALVFPVGDGVRYRFTRRSSTAAHQREFVSHGLRMWTRAEWTAFVSGHRQELDAVFDLIFTRGGMTRGGVHGGGEIEGVPALPLSRQLHEEHWRELLQGLDGAESGAES